MKEGVSFHSILGSSKQYGLCNVVVEANMGHHSHVGLGLGPVQLGIGDVANYERISNTGFVDTFIELVCLMTRELATVDDSGIVIIISWRLGIGQFG